MKRVVYMNHRLKDSANRLAERPKPVITLQENGRERHVHALEIRDKDNVLLATVRWSPNGCRQVKTHHVAAWVEIEDRAIVTTRKSL